MTASDELTAREIIARSQADLIVICRFGPFARLYRPGTYEMSADKQTFSARLLAGEIPSWLKLVDLPEDLGDSFLVLLMTKDAAQ